MDGTKPLAIRHKERLPRGWSYPVGVELLSQALFDVPNAAPQPLWFSHGDELWLNDRRKRRAEDLPFPILEAEYTRHFVGPPEPDRPLWILRVSSVPSPLSAWVRSCVFAYGLPRLRTWLLHP